MEYLHALTTTILRANHIIRFQVALIIQEVSTQALPLEGACILAEVSQAVALVVASPGAVVSIQVARLEVVDNM